MLSRKRFALAAGLLAALVVLYSTAWLGTSFLTLRATERWADDQRRQGNKVTYGEPFFSGYPFRPVVTFPYITVTLPTSTGSWTWQTPALRASVLPWAAKDLVLNVSGAHTLTGPQAITGPWPTGIGTLEVAAEKATVHLRLEDDGARAGRFDAENMTATLADRETLWRADRISLDLAISSAPQSVSKVVLEADNIVPPYAVAPPLSQTIRRLRLTLELEGALQGSGLPHALETWRSSGGDLEIRNVYVDWEPMTAAGNGTLALDDQLQPMGAFALKFTGFFSGVDALTQQGIVDPGNASAAKIVLGLLAKAPVTGGPPELSLPLTIQDRKLSAGPVTLTEIPRVTWPQNFVLP